MAKTLAQSLLAQWTTPTFAITPELLPSLQDQTIHIRQLSLGETQLIAKIEDEYAQSCEMFSLAVVDEDNEAIFTSEVVAQLPQRIVSVVATSIQYFTGGCDAKALTKLLELERDEANPFAALEKEGIEAPKQSGNSTQTQHS